MMVRVLSHCETITGPTTSLARSWDCGAKYMVCTLPVTLRYWWQNVRITVDDESDEGAGALC